MALALLRTVPGLGEILGLSIVYEIERIERFPRVQDLLSYGRLVKPTKESAGKILGHSARKIGNAHLKWAFSEAAVCVLRGNRRAQALRVRLAAKHGKGKSLSIIAARLARAVYFMLKRRTPFDAERCFAHSGSAGTKGSSLNVPTGAAVQGVRPERSSTQLTVPASTAAELGRNRMRPAAPRH